MKKLILVRHAKSSWNEPGLSDRDRPLNDRGERDAPKMGERLAKEGVKPDVILSSPAVRALATAQIIAGKLDFRRKDIRVDERLYLADADDLLEVIRELDDEAKRVMLVGHNPGLADLAHRCSSTISDMPTCAVAMFGFDAKSWADVGDGSPATATLLTPKHA
jgi:phosphohistidine phosphatase